MIFYFKNSLKKIMFQLFFLLMLSLENIRNIIIMMIMYNLIYNVYIVVILYPICIEILEYDIWKEVFEKIMNNTNT